MNKIIKNNLFMLSYLHKVSPAYLIINILVSSLSAIMSVGNLIFIKMVTDNISSNSTNFKIIVFYILIYSTFIIISSSMTAWLNDSFNPRENLKIQLYMQNIMFDKIKSIDVSCYENSEFYNKYVLAMNEIDSRIFQIANTIIGLLAGLVSVASITGVMSKLDPIFILFSLLMVANSLFQSFRNNKLGYKLNIDNTINNREREYAKRIYYLNQYAKELKLFSIWELIKNKYITATNNVLKVLSYYTKKILVTDLISTFLGTTINIAMLFYLISRVINRTLTVGDFIILSTAVNNLASHLTGLLRSFPNLKIYSLYIDNLIEVLNFKSTISEDDSGIIINDDIPVNIKVSGLHFSYSNSTQNQILKDITFAIKQGQKVAIVGNNGSGKSTFIKILLRLYEYDSGVIHYGDIDYKHANTTSLRSKFGIVFQDHQIYALTIAQNILMEDLNNLEQEKLVWEALKFSGLDEKVMTLPKGINSVITKEFDEEGIYLSGGEQQKLTIARAYASKCSVLILDEPSSSLDPIAENNLFENLMNLGKEKTIIYISHKLSSTINADMVYLFDNGSIIEKGTHKELLKQNKVYAEMFDLQSKKYINN